MPFLQSAYASDITCPFTSKYLLNGGHLGDSKIPHQHVSGSQHLFSKALTSRYGAKTYVVRSNGLFSPKRIWIYYLLSSWISLGIIFSFQLYQANISLRNRQFLPSLLSMYSKTQDGLLQCIKLGTICLSKVLRLHHTYSKSASKNLTLCSRDPTLHVASCTLVWNFDIIEHRVGEDIVWIQKTCFGTTYIALGLYCLFSQTLRAVYFKHILVLVSFTDFKNPVVYAQFICIFVWSCMLHSIQYILQEALHDY